LAVQQKVVEGLQPEAEDEDELGEAPTPTPGYPG